MEKHGFGIKNGLENFELDNDVNILNTRFDYFNINQSKNKL